MCRASNHVSVNNEDQKFSFYKRISYSKTAITAISPNIIADFHSINGGSKVTRLGKLWNMPCNMVRVTHRLQISSKGSHLSPLTGTANSF